MFLKINVGNTHNTDMYYCSYYLPNIYEDIYGITNLQIGLCLIYKSSRENFDVSTIFVLLTLNVQIPVQ